MQALKPAERYQVTEVLFNEEGYCNYCQLYVQNYDAQALKQELNAFIQVTQKEPVVLALSGGKDSLTALYLARVLLQLEVRCVLYQNGFIPDKVIAQARRICNELSVPLDVITHSLQAEFKAEYPSHHGKRIAKTGLDFCQICARQLGAVAVPYLQKHRSQWLLLGNKNYARLQPTVSAIKPHQVEGFAYHSVNVLYALRITASQQQAILELMNWKDPQLSGYTSNCLVPGLVEAARFEKLGVASDRGYIEMELRSGAYTLAEVEHLLDLKTLK